MKFSYWLTPSMDWADKMSRWHAEAYRDLHKHRALFVLKPFHLPVRWWHALGGRYMLLRLLFRMGFLATPEGQKFSLKQLRWPLVTARTRDYARLLGRQEGREQGYSAGLTVGHQQGHQEGWKACRTWIAGQVSEARDEIADLKRRLQ